MTWDLARAWMPFIAGVVGGGAIIVAVVISWHAGWGVLSDRDWQYFILQALSALVIGIGGALVLRSVLEI
jgi:cation transport ATPase